MINGRTFFPPSLLFLILSLVQSIAQHALNQITHWLTFSPLGSSLSPFSLFSPLFSLPPIFPIPYDYSHLQANKATADMRLKIANACLDDMVQWFSQGGQVGILDGSNTTAERRQELVERFKACNVQPMFIETICDNPAIVDANIRSVKVSSPDVSHLSLSFRLFSCTRGQNDVWGRDLVWKVVIDIVHVHYKERGKDKERAFFLLYFLCCALSCLIAPISTLCVIFARDISTFRLDIHRIDSTSDGIAQMRWMTSSAGSPTTNHSIQPSLISA